jgi:hypothetical protein
MAIVKQYHKDTNTTYVYESESYWDAEKGQSRSRRRVIGKLDPETGEIIPTGKRGRKKKDPAQDIPGPSDGTAALYAQSLEKIQALEERIRTLEQQVSGLESGKFLSRKAPENNLLASIDTMEIKHVLI